MTFQLDTSGTVLLVADPGYTARQETAWPDLTHFAQGYVEAVFAELASGLSEWIEAESKLRSDYGGNAYVAPSGMHHATAAQFAKDAVARALLGFSDLAPETLARIIADCERYDALTSGHPRSQSKHFALTAQQGRDFWNGRQRSKPVVVHAEIESGLRLRLEHFPPLTVSLNDQGKVVFGGEA